MKKVVHNSSTVRCQQSPPKCNYLLSGTLPEMYQHLALPIFSIILFLPNSGQDRIDGPGIQNSCLSARDICSIEGLGYRRKVSLGSISVAYYCNMSRPDGKWQERVERRARADMKQNG